ncbi:N-acetylglucosamine kinase [Devosia sp.]|uniref:N-acetylglucosamine kinase n=1 Tax=Devosia sp. TaxID=1871048 RepID=UPI001AD1E4C8|nr:BadF/BadG/BcrA/BcrD ATPase family protein [Devosia sp.]MBN9334544.1 ATPase [Devosia sp.]
MDQLVAGMDVGGTKTQVMVLRGDEVIANETVLSSSWRTWRLEEDARGLAALARRVAGGPLLSLAAGAHGCDSDAQCQALQGALGAELDCQVTVVNDSELLVPAAGYVSGIGVVSGTGSIAVARDSAGHMLAAGGWGWILGDEGSAAAIVREAAKAVRGAIDRNRLDDPLIAAMLAALDTTEVTKLGRLLNEVRGAAEWGRHANTVFAAADNGSALARRVIVEGAEALAGLVGVLVERGANSAVVVAGGSVFAHQPLLFDTFRTAVHSFSPQSEVVLLKADPVVGAAAIASRVLTGRPAQPVL